MGNVQKLDWGSIDWVYEPSAGSDDHMKVGISRMTAGSVQPRHTHSGDEQLMYILSGQGRQKIDDVEHPIEPGRIYHISSGMSHETINDGPEEIVKLLVSIPAALDSEPAVWQEPAQGLGTQGRIDPKEFLRQTVQEIAEQMLSPLKLPVSIYDVDEQIVYQNREYPLFCRCCCGIEEDEKACCLYREKTVYTAPYYAEPSAYVCQYGLSLYTRPILCDGELLGYLKTGHIRTSAATVDEFPAELPYNVPSSTVTGILQIMEKLCRIICNYYRFAKIEVGLEDSQRALSDRQEREELLQASLRTSQNKAMNLQLNQHFLFNTLNMIMSMAIREGAEQTYQAVSSLALLMQYTLRSDSYFVTLRQEVEYLKNYVSLQQMRFGKRLTVHYDIDGGLLQEDVPFNFLQPIAENCFKHGFAGQGDQMELSVFIGRRDGFLVARIEDNGRGMDADRLRYLRQVAKTGGADHGTAMVTRKLDALYGSAYRYHIESGGQGTCVSIEIPRKGGRRHEAGSSCR